MNQYTCKIEWIAWDFIQHNSVGPDCIQIFKLDLQDYNIVGRGEWEVRPGKFECEPIFTLGRNPETFTDPSLPTMHIYSGEIFNSLNDCVNRAIAMIFSGKF